MFYEKYTKYERYRSGIFALPSDKSGLDYLVLNSDRFDILNTEW